MRINRRTVHTLDTPHGEVELEFEPYCEDDVLVERVGDKLVVSYLAIDTSPSNPMEEFDAQGTLITKSSRRGRITDDEGQMLAELCLDSYDQPDIDRTFPCTPWIDHRGLQQSCTTLRDLAAAAVFVTLEGDPSELAAWVENYYGVEDLVSRLDRFWDSEGMVRDLRQDLQDVNGLLSERVEELAVKLYPGHWRALVGPMVVPMDYSDYGNEVSISPMDWDGDVDSLPEAIWIPDKAAEENIRSSARPDNVSIDAVDRVTSPNLLTVTESGVEIFRGTWEQCLAFVTSRYPVTDDMLFQTARRYAAAVCEEYAHYCNGDVFGCVTQTFDLKCEPEGGDPEWIPYTDWDSCWGYIGREYAQGVLASDYFDPTVQALCKRLEAQAQPAEPALLDPADSEGGLTD